MKKWFALCLTFLFCISQSSIFTVAQTDTTGKEESVYGVLNDDGSFTRVYVVNAIRTGSSDFGSYDSIENLSGVEPLAITDGTVELPDFKDIFYYQGIFDHPTLPWNFNITYELDGTPVTAQTLSGATGALKIHIDVTQGDRRYEALYKGYALQISLSLSDALCSNIIADQATMVEAGGSKQLSFTLLPGNIGSFDLSCDISDFSMDPITINAVKMFFDLNIDTASFTDQLDELTDAVAQLDDGAVQLKEGIQKLASGFSTFSDGLNTYKSGISDFASQGDALAGGLGQLSQGLETLTAQNDALKAGISGMEAGAFQQADLQLQQYGLNLPTLTKENYKQILSGQDALAPLLAQLEQTLQLTGGLSAYLDGAKDLSTGTKQISSGVTQYVQGAKQLASAADKLYDGTKEINQGLSELSIGMNVYQAGTSTFKSSTSNMKPEIDAQIQTMLNQFTGNELSLVSFASEKNTEIQSVQFFFRTKGIEALKAPEIQIPAEEKTTFWQRLLHLFGL